MKRLHLNRDQILAFRRRVGHLDERLPYGEESLARIAWAGLQDSMPRAALLSIHARMERTAPDTWQHPSLVQLWGPRFSVFVVAEKDRGVFSLGRLTDDPQRLAMAEDLAQRLESFLDGARMPARQAARGMGAEHSLRYAAPTGRVLMRWEGARQPEIWTVAQPDIDPAEARLELVRRHLHIFGPTTAQSFGLWAGIKPYRALEIFESLGESLLPVATPVGDGFILASDEADIRSTPDAPAPARLLPSGDAYYLLQGVDRELLVTDPTRRSELWTSRVWPGAVLVGGEIVGIWRRSQHKVDIETWQPLSDDSREAVENEAMSLPIPGVDPGSIRVRWQE